jgi:uncharacterized membrane protein
LLSEAVTAGWTVFFVILIPFTLFPIADGNGGKIAFAAALVIANGLYRRDKGSRGTWICSIPFKLLMAAMVGYLILYHTNVLCFSS